MIKNALFQLLAQAKIDLDPLPGAKAGDPQIQIVLNIVFSIAAALALLFIVIGGVRYMLSRGDPSATAQAKNSILYALIGLVVTVSAYAIVRLVVSNV